MQPDTPPSVPICDARFHAARKSEARAVAELIEIAGEGIPRFLWSQQAEAGEDPLDVGTARARREDANFSYRNAVRAFCDDAVAGMLLAYRLPPPSAEDLAALSALPALLRPLVELEAEVPGSFYINALAVHAPYRNQGLGSDLLMVAEARARDAGCVELSLQVFAENEAALRFYLRHGYEVVARRPIVPHVCYPYSTEVLLMTRPLEK